MQIGLQQNGGRMSKLYDVAIVGGGVAGLSAALILGRCLRSVLVFDDGHPRNEASPAAHCLLANEGIAPAELLRRSRRELQNFQHVVVQQRTVDWIHSEQKAFAIFSEGGLVATSRKVLLTTGLKDQLPDIVGIENYYGRSVHHCPYCDGYEHRDKVIIAYGKGDKGAGLALMMKQWTSDVILCTDGALVTLEMQTRLEDANIRISTEKVAKLEGDLQGGLQRVVLATGAKIDCNAMFFTTECAQRSDLGDRLGCKRDEKGGAVTDPLTEESSVPGIYIAGDASRDVLLLAVAIGEGAKAGVAINKALLKEDGLG